MAEVPGIYPQQPAHVRPPNGTTGTKSAWTLRRQMAKRCISGSLHRIRRRQLVTVVAWWNVLGSVIVPKEQQPPLYGAMNGGVPSGPRNTRKVRIKFAPHEAKEVHVTAVENTAPPGMPTAGAQRRYARQGSHRPNVLYHTLWWARRTNVTALEPCCCKRFVCRWNRNARVVAFGVGEMCVGGEACKNGGMKGW